MKQERTKFLAQAALIAAIYTVLTLIFQPISFGAVQFRVSEALCILPYFSFAAVPGLSVGCLLANALAGAPLPDIVFGTLATLIGAVGSWQIRKLSRFLVWLPPVLSNALIIPVVLRYAAGAKELIPWMMLTVGAGELLAAALLGNLLLLILEQQREFIFGREYGSDQL